MLVAAIELMADERYPSVAEVADAADISRRTAYRYFPTQEQLLVEAALEGLRPAMVGAVEDIGGKGDDSVDARLDRAVTALQRQAIANEPLLRTMIRLTVGSDVRPATGRGGGGRRTARRVPRRGYRRLEWIALALAPVRTKLGKRRYGRLVSALAVCVGIDALIVLRDICGLSDGEAEEVTRWAARALLRASLAEGPARPPGRGAGRR